MSDTNNTITKGEIGEQNTMESYPGAHKRSRSAASSSEAPPISGNSTAPEASTMTGELATDISEPTAEPTKEELYEQAKARKIATITTRNTHLSSEIERLTAEIEVERALLKNEDAADTVKTHIKLLHEYNEIRDVGQGMIGMIADNRGVRIAELYESGEFGVGVKD